MIANKKKRTEEATLTASESLTKTSTGVVQVVGKMLVRDQLK
jgi:hypothetical protein